MRRRGKKGSEEDQTEERKTEGGPEGEKTEKEGEARTWLGGSSQGLCVSRPWS